MNTFYVICGIVVVVLVLGFIILPIAKAKGWINKLIALKLAKGVNTSIDIVQAIIKAAELKNVKIGAVNAVLDLADIATDFVVELIDADTTAQKIDIARKVTDQVLKEIGITPTEAQQRLITIVIEQGVDFLVGENKKLLK